MNVFGFFWGGGFVLFFLNSNVDNTPRHLKKKKKEKKRKRKTKEKKNRKNFAYFEGKTV